MNRPYVSFAEVKQKVPIPDALAALGLLDRFERRSGTLVGVCPLPRHKHGPRPNSEQFKINRKDGVWLWHCFGDCKRGGDVLELVKELTGYDNAHVRFWFAEKFGDRLTLAKTNSAKEPRVEKDTARNDSEEPKQAAPVTPSNLPIELAPLKPLRFHLNLDPAAPYLRNRGLTEETIRRFGLGLCSKGLLRGYVAIPVYRHPRGDGENPVAYLGRWAGEDYSEDKGRPRYKWPDGFCKSRVVYGLSEALNGTDGKPLIVVEGPFKLYHLVQNGLPNTVSTLGSSLSDEQAGILSGIGRPILLMFDGDAAGQLGMQTAIEKLANKAFVRGVRLPDGVESDDLTKEELAFLLA
jgi:DNA primase